MQQPQYLNQVHAYAVDDDKRGTGNHEFACIPYAPRAAQRWMFHKIFHGLQDALTGFCGRTRVILSDVVARGVEIPKCARGPSKLHAYPIV